MSLQIVDGNVCIYPTLSKNYSYLVGLCAKKETTIQKNASMNVQ